MTHLDLHLSDATVASQSDEALHALAALNPGTNVDLLASGRHDPIRLPAEALVLLREVLAHFAKGNAVAVVPVAAEVTAQQAAELLQVSRPFVIRLIDEGKLPCRMVGTHRRIPLVDLLAFKEAHKARARAAAAELTQDAQDLGFGY